MEGLDHIKVIQKLCTFTELTHLSVNTMYGYIHTYICTYTPNYQIVERHDNHGIIQVCIRENWLTKLLDILSLSYSILSSKIKS